MDIMLHQCMRRDHKYPDATWQLLTKPPQLCKNNFASVVNSVKLPACVRDWASPLEVDIQGVTLARLRPNVIQCASGQCKCGLLKQTLSSVLGMAQKGGGWDPLGHDGAFTFFVHAAKTSGQYSLSQQGTSYELPPNIFSLVNTKFKRRQPESTCGTQTNLTVHKGPSSTTFYSRH